MQIKEDSNYNSGKHGNSASQPFQATDAVEWRAHIAITVGILIAMAAQALTRDNHVVSFALSVQFFTDMTSTALADKLIDEVGCS